MKTKCIILTFIVFTLSFSMRAQELQIKYEFLIIKYCADAEKLSVSVNGQEFSSVKIDIPKNEKSSFNANPLLKSVNEYQDKNWELISFNNVIIGMGARGEDYDIAYMRRKKNK